jgi:very-short-patch-repair endonuclease
LRAIDVPVAAKQVIRLRRGWVALPDAPAEVTRAVRAGGTVSCISALRRSEVWTLDDERLHLRLGRHANFVAAEGKRPTVADIGAAGIVPHRTRTRVSPSAAVGGVDRIDIALAHAILCQRRNDAVAAVDSALQRGLIHLPALTEVVRSLPAEYLRLLDLVDGRAESGIESHARLGLRAVGIECRVQVRIDGVGRVDLLVGDRLIIEVDGRRWHSLPDQVQRDKARDLAAVERQYIVLRLTLRAGDVRVAARAPRHPRHRRARRAPLVGAPPLWGGGAPLVAGQRRTSRHPPLSGGRWARRSSLSGGEARYLARRSVSFQASGMMPAAMSALMMPPMMKG